MNACEVAVIGAGPSGLMAAERLARGGARVTVYERMPSAGRKFLMAGRGGLNLTHSEPLDNFLTRYGDASARLRGVIEAFPPQALRDWCEALGHTTFVGSSGRVFPKVMKASPLLRAWLRQLDAMGVRLMLRHDWRGWNEEGALSFATPSGGTSVKPDATVLALGGASWPKLGSDGSWVDDLTARDIGIASFQPANCGFNVAWSPVFRDRFEGVPLKSVMLSHGEQHAKGDIIITRSGLEGGAIYQLSARLRNSINTHGGAVLTVALRPDMNVLALAEKLSAPRGKKSMSTFLRKAAGLSAAEIGLLQEAAIVAGHQLSQMSPAELAALINAVPVHLTGTAPIARAISSAGGIDLAEIDECYMLRKMPGVFVAGEMLDWEAPTGGYLLQASFATGVAAGEGALRWLAARAKS